MRVEPCLTIGDPNCVLLGDAGFNPAQPLAFPTNFPSEFFYSLVDSDPAFTVTDPACGADRTRIDADRTRRGVRQRCTDARVTRPSSPGCVSSAQQPLRQLDVRVHPSVRNVQGDDERRRCDSGQCRNRRHPQRPHRAPAGGRTGAGHRWWTAPLGSELRSGCTSRLPR